MKEKIPRRSTHCCAGGEPLAPGSEYISVLTSTEEGYERADYCLACFEKITHKSGQFWKGKIPQKVEKRQTPDEKALELFLAEEDPHLLAVLALYLQRRGQIIRRGEEKKMDVYEIPETGEAVAIPKVSLSPEQGKEAGEKLVRLLDEPSS